MTEATMTDLRSIPFHTADGATTRVGPRLAAACDRVFRLESGRLTAA